MDENKNKTSKNRKENPEKSIVENREKLLPAKDIKKIKGEK